MTKKVLIEIPTETLSNVQNGTMDMDDVRYALRAIKGGEEQKVGKWIRGGYCCGDTEWKCPICGASEWRTNATPFCMWCGAKMEGADNE